MVSRQIRSIWPSRCPPDILTDSQEDEPTRFSAEAVLAEFLRRILVELRAIRGELEEVNSHLWHIEDPSSKP